MKYIFANWKNKLSFVESDELLSELINKNYNNLFVFPDITQVIALSLKHNVKLGLQGFAPNSTMPATGYPGIKDIEKYVSYSLIGHSERRQLGETDFTVAEQYKLSKEKNIKTIFCVGESAEDRDSNHTLSKIFHQLSFIGKPENIIVAYEPIWSIGTGKVLELEEAKYMLQEIKNYFLKHFNHEIEVVYGGSVNVENCKEWINCGYDGLLIGGASQNLTSLESIINKI